MKFFRLYSFVMLVSATTALGYSQQRKWNVLLGGSSTLNFSSVTTKVRANSITEELGKTRTLSFSPLVGVFLVDGLALGIDFPYSSTYSKSESGDETKSSSVAFAPFFRYYVELESVKPYIHGEFGGGLYKDKPESGDEVDYDMFLYKVGAGVGIFFTERISMDVGVLYSYQRLKPDLASYDGVFIGSGLNLTVGIVLVL